MAKVILITGATGKQGKATVTHLIQSNSDVIILAVTRNPSSEAARSLALKSDRVKLVRGDVNSPTRIFDEAFKICSQPVWGVFCVLVSPSASHDNNHFGLNECSKATLLGGVTPEQEEQQGKDFVDECLRRNVKFFAYSSVDRGDSASLENPTYVPHFLSKHNIEKHILKRTENGTKMGYCFIRPVAFLDQLAPPYGGSFAAMWKDLGSKTLQMIAVSDIGAVTARVLLDPEPFWNQGVSLAGFDMGYEQGAKEFRDKVGYEMPVTVSFTEDGPPDAIEEWRLMVKWFKEVGYGVDIAKARELHPNMLSWQGWLERESGYI